jgi:diaminopimelate epimerase
VTLTQTEFFKMTAAGNDFIAFDNRPGMLRDSGLADLTRRLCTRALSVGADGVILLEESREADIRARFLNPDGQPTFCGNGARCAARLAFLKGLAPARMSVQTDLGLHRAEVSANGVSFEMREAGHFEERVEVASQGRLYAGALIDTGVPHYVVVEEGPQGTSFEETGRSLRRHPRFAPAGTNVDFVHPIGNGLFAIRTYERGVEGETLACGTGCVAAALALSAAGKARSPVEFRTRSGASLRVRFEGDARRAAGIRLEGEARLVFVGQLTDEALSGFTPAAR